VAETTIELQPVKGTRDFYPEDMRVRNWLFGHWRAIATKYGYEEYDACVLEHEQLYVRKAGDEITGQLYNFEDKGNRRVALRPELTPSLARMIMARGAAQKLPARWFAIPQCFRYERMQRGRGREHFQWNMDIVGLAHVAAEAELMAAQLEFLRAVGFKIDAEKTEVELRVSNRMLLQHALESMGIQGDQFGEVCVIIDKLEKIGPEATSELLEKANVHAEARAQLLKLLSLKGIEQVKSEVPATNPGVAALEELVAMCDSFGISQAVKIDLSVIRGLSYYTGTVWEVFETSGALPRAIAGGGRYDRLVEHFGGKHTPMAGFGFGDMVLIELVRERGLLPALPRSVDDVVYPMCTAEFAIANKIATALRAKGRIVLVDYAQRRFKHAVKSAEDEGAKRMLVLGGNEVAEGVCLVRTIGTERNEEKVPIASLLS
jgi:histidyl-tRNA synthetase